MGLGYVGPFIGLGIGFLLRDTLGYEWVFRATALLFAVFAVPIFLWVREPRVGRPGSDHGVAGAFRQVLLGDGTHFTCQVAVQMIDLCSCPWFDLHSLLQWGLPRPRPSVPENVA